MWIFEIDATIITIQLALSVFKQGPFLKLFFCFRSLSLSVSHRRSLANKLLTLTIFITTKTVWSSAVKNCESTQFGCLHSTKTVKVNSRNSLNESSASKQIVGWNHVTPKKHTISLNQKAVFKLIILDVDYLLRVESGWKLGRTVCFCFCRLFQSVMQNIDTGIGWCNDKRYGQKLSQFSDF